MKIGISLSKGLFPLLFSSLIILYLAGCAEDNHILDNGQSRQLEFSVKTCGWNSSNSNSSDQKIPSRATPITGNTFDTSKNFNIIADVNKGGNWSTEVNNETASYSTADNIWQTSKIHYWPGTGSTVDFYAYYPVSISSEITHTTGSAPVLSYTVPDNATDQIDILASSKTGIAGDSYNQTPVDFKHIFAAVQFSIGSSGLPNGTITGVTLNNIQYKGAYSLDGTWTPNTTDKKSFSQTVSVPTSTGTVITSGTTAFMMMPQTLSGDASITVTYSNGGSLTKAIIGTWEAGKTYTYNLSYLPRTFSYTGTVQTYTVPITGTYKLEVWGAQGGTDSSDSITAGKGGYAQGQIRLSVNQILYIYVGGQGEPTKSNGGGGYNGGGSGGSYAESSDTHAGGGGGATHIASTSGLLSTLSDNRNSVFIVGGGGGGYCHGSSSTDKHYGGSGGGTIGGNSIEVSNEGGKISYGGTQISGYLFGIGQDGHNGTIGSRGEEAGGGCGGGWYGGEADQSTGANSNSGGSGGSGYIDRVANCSMQSGVRSGNGYARITFISAD